MENVNNMEAEQKLKELNLTADEVARFKKAFKDEKFKGLLLDYAKELSDPENKKRYEEEIKLMEGERGNVIDFIHPQPYRALKTSVDGKQKCFVNICTNEKVDKPEFKWGVSEDGRSGQHWSLPHSLHPGRQERDGKGNKFMIYDVIFHPDTIHMASRNNAFLCMVESTAIQGIQDGFKVRLDQNNIKVLTIKYKGTPQPCVMRKLIPGFKAEDPPANPDPLAFPYPDDNPPGAAAQNKPTACSKSQEESKTRNFTTKPHKPGEPTTPNYRLKYRSYVDLQDFRCSRVSGQNQRPKEIVVTVDMPLLKSAKYTNLEVLGRSLLVESMNPAYRLELSLAYPVDKDKGEAKFNKQSGQLTITLPVTPLTQPLEFTVGGSQAVGEYETEEEEASTVKGEGQLKEQIEEAQGGDWKESTLKTEAEENGEIQSRASERNEHELLEYKQESKSGIKESEDGSEIESIKDKASADGTGDAEVQAETPHKDDVPRTMHADTSSTEERHCERPHDRNEVPANTEHQQASVVVNDEDRLEVAGDDMGEKSEGSENCLTTKESMGTTEGEDPPGSPAEHQHLNGTSSTETPTQHMPACHVSDGNAGTGAAEFATLQSPQNNQQMCDEVKNVLATGSDNPLNTEPGGTQTEAAPATPEDITEEVDEDDFLAAQSMSKSDFTWKPLPLLREVDESGKETVISDHSTSAGLSFQNSLLYELD